MTETEKKLLTAEELESGIRLACRTFAHSPLSVELFSVPKQAVNKNTISFFPEGFVPSHPFTAPNCYGVSFDIGTTTIVGMLFDLSENTLIGSKAMTNPQSAYGADIISRIRYALDGNQEPLQHAVLEALRNLLLSFFDEYNIPTERLFRITCACNTAMSHLLLGISPETLAVYPFQPAFCHTEPMPFSRLGLPGSQKGAFYLLPNIGGHVGSDITAVMLASRLPRTFGTFLAIDIGTNGEIVLSHNGTCTVCAAAAGPAFEGAGIRHGMRAAEGSIEKVTFLPESVLLKTIGQASPVGICGSGLIDAAAELLRSRLLEPSGHLLSETESIQKGIAPALAKHLFTAEDETCFLLCEPSSDGTTKLFLSQKDIRELQLAKGAIAAAILTLLSFRSLNVSDLDAVYVAGAFGNYLNKRSGKQIGLFPAVPLSRIHFIGNAAGTGAGMALLSENCRKRSETIASEAQHIELSLQPDFQEHYLKEMMFPDAIY